jgi:acyl-CoA reductase-like NAD-dependent aldehyde dehydrogenase
MDHTVQIGGEWVAVWTDATMPVMSLFDRSLLGIATKSAREDARRAIDAARGAFYLPSAPDREDVPLVRRERLGFRDVPVPGIDPSVGEDQRGNRQP